MESLLRFFLRLPLRILINLSLLLPLDRVSDLLATGNFQFASRLDGVLDVLPTVTTWPTSLPAPIVVFLSIIVALVAVFLCWHITVLSMPYASSVGMYHERGMPKPEAYL